MLSSPADSHLLRVHYGYRHMVLHLCMFYLCPEQSIYRTQLWSSPSPTNSLGPILPWTSFSESNTVILNIIDKSSKTAIFCAARNTADFLVNLDFLRHGIPDIVSVSLSWGYLPQKAALCCVTLVNQST